MDTLSSPPRANAGKYLTFRLGSESFGIDVLRIRTIIRNCATSRLPHMPDHMQGIINLRGSIVPVVDLRLRFSLPAVERTEHACIVVVEVNRPRAGAMLMGLIVDSVDEVMNVGADDIADTPDVGSSATNDCLRGVAMIKDTLKSLLDIDRILSADCRALAASGAAV